MILKLLTDWYVIFMHFYPVFWFFPLYRPALALVAAPLLYLMPVKKCIFVCIFLFTKNCSQLFVCRRLFVTKICGIEVIATLLILFRVQKVIPNESRVCPPTSDHCRLSFFLFSPSPLS